MGRTRAKDLQELRFGKLLVVSRAENGKHNHARWLCQCDCGNTKVIHQTNLTSGQSTSCGCILVERSLKHGHCVGYEISDTYETWSSMIKRCHNPKAVSYDRYGARGIKVCDLWLNSFEHFLSDMGERPIGMSIERLDNEGDYTPENCVWAGVETQVRNRRSNHWLTHQNTTLCLEDWAKRVGLSGATIAKRLKRGWTVEQALTTPSRHNRN